MPRRVRFQANWKLSPDCLLNTGAGPSDKDFERCQVEFSELTQIKKDANQKDVKIKNNKIKKSQPQWLGTFLYKTKSCLAF